MSKGTKLVVGILVVVVVGALIMKSGWLGGTGESQTASVDNAANSAAVDNSDATLGLNVNAIDTQLQGIQADLNTASSTTQLIAVAARVQVASGLMNKLGVKLQPRIINSGKTALQSTLADMDRQLSNGTSQAGSASKNASKAAVTDPGAIAQAQAQLKTALTFLQAARGDIQTIINGIKGTTAPTGPATSTSHK